jgi:Domain of unknown function (DUF4351)
MSDLKRYWIVVHYETEVEALSVEQLEDLSIAVLNFNSLEDLSAYLQTQND